MTKIRATLAEVTRARKGTIASATASGPAKQMTYPSQELRVLGSEASGGSRSAPPDDDPCPLIGGMVLQPSVAVQHHYGASGVVDDGGLALASVGPDDGHARSHVLPGH